MGPGSAYAKMCKIKSIRPSSDNTVQIQAIVEDNRVHSADLPYKEDPDGPGGPGGTRRTVYMADGTPVYDASSDAQHSNGGYYTDADGKVGTPLVEGYKYDA